MARHNLKEWAIPPPWRLVTKGSRRTTSFSADKSRHVRSGATDWRSLCCQGRVQTVVWKEPSRLNGWEKGISWYKWKRIWITQGIGPSGMKWMHLEWQNSQHHNNNYAVTMGGSAVLERKAVLNRSGVLSEALPHSYVRKHISFQFVTSCLVRTGL